MSGERTRAVNALTARVRTGDVSVDARRALTATIITTITPWRTRGEDRTLTICRTQAPQLLDRPSIGRSSPRRSC